MKSMHYLVLGSDECDNLRLENGKIKRVDKLKHLGVIINKQGNSNDEFQVKITKGSKTIGALNSVFWEWNIIQDTKSSYAQLDRLQYFDIWFRDVGLE